MKIKNIKIKIPYLSNEMIENQAWQDLVSFQKAVGKKTSFPIYPDEIIEKLWNIEIQYVDEWSDCTQDDWLACYLPDLDLVKINNKQKGVEGRVSFSLAHEAGHISLHRFLLKDKGFKKLDDSNQIERQADIYAKALLMPKESIFLKLKSLGYDNFQHLDLKVYGESLTDYFGVSFQALEIRLQELGVNILNGYYKTNKKLGSVVFEKMEEERQGWDINIGRT